MIQPRSKLRGPQLYNACDRAALSSAASLARTVLNELLAMAVDGMTPATLERLGRERLHSIGAHATMASLVAGGSEQFGHACSVSIDDNVAHARPTDEPLRTGQLVTIDLMLAIDGWHADVADSAVVGGGGHPLLTALDAVWAAGLGAIRPGGTWTEVARAMDLAAKASRARMVQGLAGHGIGLAPHELPILPLTPSPIDPTVTLRPGMVFTLEPVITTGSGKTLDSDDGWAIRTADGAPAVGREALIAVLDDGFRVLGGPGLDDS